MASASILSSVTFVPIYLDEIGATNDFIVITVAIYAFFAFLSSMTFGRLADRPNLGRKVFIKLGLLFSTGTFIFQFFLTTPEGLLLTRVLAGFAVGIYPGAMFSYAFETGHKLGKFSAFGSLGWSFGSLIAGLLATLFPTNSVFLLSGLFFFISFLFVLRLEGGDMAYPPPSSQLAIRPSATDVFRNNSGLYLSFFVRHSAANAIWTLWPIFLRAELSFDNVEIGIIQATNAGTQFLVMILFTDSRRSFLLYEFGAFLSGVTFISFLVTKEFALFLGTQILLGISWGTMFVGAVRFIAEKNDVNARSTASGYLTGIIMVSQCIGPLYVYLILLFFPGSLAYYIIIIFAAAMSFFSVLSFLLYYQWRTKGEPSLIPA